MLVNKLDYRFGSPKRLDAVILELENGSTTHYSVKRVIGLPGETVWKNRASINTRHDFCDTI